MARGGEADDFLATIAPHLPAGYALARWLMGNAPDAEDAVQDACLRAFRAQPGPAVRLPRAWWLAIVRNACHSALRRRSRRDNVVRLDEQGAADPPDDAPDPFAALAAKRERAQLHQALAALPPLLREVLVLREIEGLSYRELAEVLAIPEGTVMSRLSRARARLAAQLAEAGAGQHVGRHRG